MNIANHYKRRDNTILQQVMNSERIKNRQSGRKRTGSKTTTKARTSNYNEKKNNDTSGGEEKIQPE